MYKILSQSISDDNIRDILLRSDYNSLITLVTLDEEYQKFVNNDGFWEEYLKYFNKYTVEECIKNNWYFLLFHKIKLGETVDDNFISFNNSNAQCLKALLTYTNYDPSVNDNKLIESATQNEQTEVVRVLVKFYKKNKGGKIEKRSIHVVTFPLLYDPLIIASQKNNVEIVKLLIENLSYEDDYNMAFLHACKKDSFDVAKLLLEKGADPTMNYNMPLKISLRGINKKIVKLLFKKPRYDIRRFSNNEKYEKIKIIQLLLQDDRVLKIFLEEIKPLDDDLFVLTFVGGVGTWNLLPPK